MTNGSEPQEGAPLEVTPVVKDLTKKLHGWQAVAGIALVVIFGGPFGLKAFWDAKYPYEERVREIQELKHQLETQRRDFEKDLDEEKAKTTELKHELKVKTKDWEEAVRAFYELKAECSRAGTQTGDIVISAPCTSVLGSDAVCGDVSQ